MSQQDDETPHRRRRRVATAPGTPPNSSDILCEIFLRLPPLPSSLPRVSFVCRRWRRLVADPDFLRRFHARHRKPAAPLLGVFEQHDGWVSFIPALDGPDRIPPRRFSMRIDYGDDARARAYHHGALLGCRHGRVLVHDPRRQEVLVCDPITGDQQRVALPPEFRGLVDIAKGAVLCANDGHVHGGCHSSPVKLVLVRTWYEAGECRGVARVYSSETGVWSDDVISTADQCWNHFVDVHRPSTLVGGSLYWWLRSSENDMSILEFDIRSETLSVIDAPPVHGLYIYHSQIIQGDQDGGVGVAALSYPNLTMWDWKIDFSCDEASTWILRKTLNLEVVVPDWRATQAEIVGYVEGEDALLIKFDENVFIIHLETMKSRKLCESIMTRRYHPFTSFYSSVKFGRCKGIPSAPTARYSSNH